MIFEKKTKTSQSYILHEKSAEVPAWKKLPVMVCVVAGIAVDMIIYAFVGQ